MAGTRKKYEVIGEGKYGCVHKPSLKCRKSRKRIQYKNKVSKIMETSEAIHELSEYNIIDKIDRNREYFLGIPIQCSPQPSDTTKRAIRQCESFDPKNIDHYNLLVMEYGGVHLKQFADKMNDAYRVTLNAPSERQKLTETMREFWTEVKRLFQGLVIFKKNGVIHYDLKPQNIVYNMDKNRVNFIDFGLMVETREALQDCETSRVMTDFHWSFPPEIILAGKKTFRRTHGSPEKKQKLFGKFLRDIDDYQDGKLNYFMEMTVERQRPPPDTTTNIKEQHIQEFRTMLFDTLDRHGYHEFVRLFLDKVDAYGLGIALIYVLHQTVPLMPPPAAAAMNALFLRMVNFNVFERVGPEEAQKIYDAIIRRYYP